MRATIRLVWHLIGDRPTATSVVYNGFYCEVSIQEPNHIRMLVDRGPSLGNILFNMDETLRFRNWNKSGKAQLVLVSHKMKLTD